MEESVHRVVEESVYHVVYECGGQCPRRGVGVCSASCSRVSSTWWLECPPLCGGGAPPPLRGGHSPECPQCGEEERAP